MKQNVAAYPTDHDPGSLILEHQQTVGVPAPEHSQSLEADKALVLPKLAAEALN